MRVVFLSKPYSWYRGIEVNRCRSDGQLVTSGADLSSHAGHYVVSPVTLTWKERVLIWLKIIQ